MVDSVIKIRHRYAKA